jgi:hypothetical protein
MGKRVKFKSRRTKANMQEAFELCVNQKRKDADGNRIKGFTFEEIMAMAPHEREHLLQTNWLRERWLATQHRRKT